MADGATPAAISDFRAFLGLLIFIMSLWPSVLLTVGKPKALPACAKLLGKASAAAFAVSESVDWLVFAITKRPLKDRVLLSCAASAPVDRDDEGGHHTAPLVSCATCSQQ